MDAVVAGLVLGTGGRIKATDGKIYEAEMGYTLSKIAGTPSNNARVQYRVADYEGNIIFGNNSASMQSLLFEDGFIYYTSSGLDFTTNYENFLIAPNKFGYFLRWDSATSVTLEKTTSAFTKEFNSANFARTGIYSMTMVACTKNSNSMALDLDTMDDIYICADSGADIRVFRHNITSGVSVELGTIVGKQLNPNVSTSAIYPKIYVKGGKLYIPTTTFALSYDKNTLAPIATSGNSQAYFIVPHLSTDAYIVARQTSSMYIINPTTLAIEYSLVTMLTPDMGMFKISDTEILVVRYLDSLTTDGQLTLSNMVKLTFPNITINHVNVDIQNDIYFPNYLGTTSSPTFLNDFIIFKIGTNGVAASYTDIVCKLIKQPIGYKEV